jgi:hypothetical protein
MVTPHTGMRLDEKVVKLLQAWGRYRNPENPSKAAAVAFLARSVPPPQDLSPAAAEVRRLHKELMES